MFVFITGASSGLGQALAKRYASEGATLGLVARRDDRLAALVKVLDESVPSRHHAYVLDVRDRDALHRAAHDFMRQAALQGQTVAVVIANAGVSAGTLTHEFDDFDVFKEIVDINLLALMTTFEPFLPTMVQAQAGCLVGIASVAGVRGLPGAGAYSASKAAVATYCESLRLELKPQGVSVVTLAPGYIRTEMTAQNPYRMPFLMDADRFAVKAIDAIARKKSFVVIPWQMGWVARLMRVLPNWLYDKILMNAPRKPRRGR